MHQLRKLFVYGVVCGIVCLLPRWVPADLVVRTQVLTPPEEIRAERQVKIRVILEDDPTTPNLIPVERVNLRVRVGDYNLVASEWEADPDSALDLGTVTSSIVVTTNTPTVRAYYRDLSTNPASLPLPITNTTPRCFDLRMWVKAFAGPFGITVEDPTEGIAIKGTDGSSIPHTFDNSATAMIVPASKCYVSTMWVSQTPMTPNATFQVRVGVQSNATTTDTNNLALVPFKPSLRVFWDSNSVAWNAAPAAGGVGTLAYSTADQNGGGTIRYRDIIAAGENLTPAVVTMTQKAATATQCTLTFSANPNFVVNRWVRVEMVPADPRFDGIHQVVARTTVAPFTITYNLAGDDVSATPVYGLVSAYNRVSQKTASATQCTLTFPISPAFAANQFIVVALDPPDPRFDGVFPIAAVTTGPPGTVTYNNPGVIVSATPSAGTATRTSMFVPTQKAATATQCTLTFPVNTAYTADTQYIRVALNPSDPRFDGVFRIAARTTTAPFTVTYDNPGAVVAATPTLGVVGRTNAALTPYMPTLFTLNFRVNNVDPVPPHAIWIEPIPGKPALTSLAAGYPELPAILDSVQTRFTPVISTELVTDPAEIKLGSTFQVRMKVTGNDTGLIPVTAYQKLNYPINQYISLVNFTAENARQDVGPVRAKNVGAYPTNYYEMYTDGYQRARRWGYTEPNPRLYLLDFHVDSMPPGPFSITLTDTTAWSTTDFFYNPPNNYQTVLPGGLTEQTHNMYIPHVLDNSATRDLSIVRVVSAERLAGSKIAPGETLHVRVKLTSNDSVSIPGSCQFRVHYPENAVTLVGATERDLGPVTFGPAQGSGTVYHDVTASAVLSAPALAECFDLEFQVVPSPVAPFSIWFSDQPTTAPLAKAAEPNTNLEHVFNNLALQDLKLSPIVGTTLVNSGIVAGEVFQVRASVLTNQVGRLPIASAFRVTYTTPTLELLDVVEGTPPYTVVRPPVCADGRDGNLGQAQLGPVTYDPATMSYYRTVATTGNYGNTNLLPKCFTLSFLAKGPLLPTRPMSITLDDPQPGSALVEKTTFANIPIGYDSSATQNLLAAVNPAQVVTQWERADGIVPGRDLRVYVRIAENDTGATPTLSNFRVLYNGDALTFGSATQGDLGSIGSTTGGSGAGSYVDISAAPNPGAATLTPTCFMLTFQVKETPAMPFSISVENAPAGTPLGMLGEETTDIPHLFDNSDTQNLAETAPTRVPSWMHAR